MTLAFPRDMWYHSIAPSGVMKLKAFPCFRPRSGRKHITFAGVMELVDVTDSKSVGLIPRVGSSPTTGTTLRGHLGEQGAVQPP